MPSGGTPSDLVKLVTGVALPLWYTVKRQRRKREAALKAAACAGIDPTQVLPRRRPFGLMLAYVVGGLLVTAAVLALYG